MRPKIVLSLLELLPAPPPIWHHNVDRKSTRLNSSHVRISYAVFCLKKKKRWDDLRQGIARSSASSSYRTKIVIQISSILASAFRYRTARTSDQWCDRINLTCHV